MVASDDAAAAVPLIGTVACGTLCTAGETLGASDIAADTGLETPTVGAVVADDCVDVDAGGGDDECECARKSSTPWELESTLAAGSKFRAAKFRAKFRINFCTLRTKRSTGDGSPKLSFESTLSALDLLTATASK